MVMPKRRLSVIAAVAATIAVGWHAPGLAQTSAPPAPAAPAAPMAAMPHAAAPMAAAPMGAAPMGAAPMAAAPQASAPKAAMAHAAPPKVAHARQSAWHRKQAARAQMVDRVQTVLNSGGANLKVDGRCGPKTMAALRVFQKQHKLKVTGLPNAATLKALGIHKS
jgi:hypothetical protein